MKTIHSGPLALSDRLALVIILGSILVGAISFLWPSPVEFPMDDTYIHFVYARNLSEYGRLFFNTPSEIGVGTSSILWDLLLAAGDRIGLPMHMVAKFLGMASLAVLGVSLYLLLRPIMQPLPSLAASLLVVLSGHMLWFALSGMETLQFLTLGFLALLSYRSQRWGWLGFLQGLLILTRIEGVLLIITIGLVDIWRHKAIRRNLFTAGLFSALIGGPWIAYLWLRTHYLLPTAGIGKHFSMITSVQIALGNTQSLTWLRQVPALTYPLTWIGYMVEFILGGAALPTPYLNINLGLGSFTYKLSWWAILGLLTVIVPLLGLSVRQVVRVLKTPDWIKDELYLPWVIFLAWMILHNLSYMIYLPSIGTASRYASLNHIALWLALALGIWYARQSWFRIWLVSGVVIIALANTLYWNTVYDANIEHMQKVRIAASDYIRTQIPPSETCAATDIGALRHFSGRPIIDLGGLIDPSISRWYLADKLDQYLIENGVGCLALPGRAGSTVDGFFDIAKELGFSHSSLFRLQQVKDFEIDRQRWLLGYLPVMNYQATVTIYQLIK